MPAMDQAGSGAVFFRRFLCYGAFGREREDFCSSNFCRNQDVSLTIGALREDMAMGQMATRYPSEKTGLVSSDKSTPTACGPQGFSF